MENEKQQLKELLKLEQREGRKRGFIYAIGFSSIFLILLFGIYLYNHESNHHQLEDAEFSQLDSIEISIQNNMQLAASPILIFNRSNSVKQLLDNDSNVVRVVFDDVFLSLITEIEIYQQIRLLTHAGMEIIRVDHLENDVFEIVEQDKLQNKSDRYYFKDTLNTPTDTIYISPFDLNVEHGKVVVPYEPIIRLGKVYESNDGNINGMMILNLRGQKILDDISANDMHINDKILLLNKEGYYLYSNEPEKNFAFMFPEKEDIGFFNEYEEVWNRILDGETAIETEDGNYYIKKITLFDPLYYNTNKNEFYLITHVPESEVHRLDEVLNNSLIVTSIVLTPVLLLLGWAFGNSRAKNKFYGKKLEVTSSYDSMTGLYNRRMVIKLLGGLIDITKANEETLSIVFIDINNLKYTNDTFGHEVGDRMIIEAANSLSHSIRSTDIASRLGGDEFLLVLPDCDEENAEEIMKRALQLFSAAGIKEIDIPWIMSYGCVELEESESLDEFMSRADHLMYEYKKASKKKK